MGSKNPGEKDSESGEARGDGADGSVRRATIGCTTSVDEGVQKKATCQAARLESLSALDRCAGCASFTIHTSHFVEPGLADTR